MVNGSERNLFLESASKRQQMPSAVESKKRATIVYQIGSNAHAQGVICSLAIFLTNAHAQSVICAQLFASKLTDQN